MYYTYVKLLQINETTEKGKNFRKNQKRKEHQHAQKAKQNDKVSIIITIKFLKKLQITMIIKSHRKIILLLIL